MIDALRSILLRLKKGAILRASGGAYRIGGRRGPKATVAADLIQSGLDEGLLAVGEEGVEITAAGLRWLEGGYTGHQELHTRLIKDEAGRTHYVVVNIAESPLGALASRGMISAVEFEAGEKLRRDYTYGQLTPRMGMDYGAQVGGHQFNGTLADTVIAARQRFGRAMTVAGPGLSDVLFDVCCYLTGLEDCEKQRHWPRGAARIVLKLALARLAAHYGFGAPERGSMRHWRRDE